MVAGLTIDCAAHWITDQTSVECGGLDLWRKTTLFQIIAASHTFTCLGAMYRRGAFSVDDRPWFRKQ